MTETNQNEVEFRLRWNKKFSSGNGQNEMEFITMFFTVSQFSYTFNIYDSSGAKI